jgi:hypothetical protein
MYAEFSVGESVKVHINDEMEGSIEKTPQCKGQIDEKRYHSSFSAEL